MTLNMWFIVVRYFADYINFEYHKYWARYIVSRYLQFLYLL